MNRLVKLAWLVLLLPLMALNGQAATPSTKTLQLITGETAKVTLSSIYGTVTLSNSATTVVAASLSGGTITVTAKMPGSATLLIKDRKSTATIAVTVKPPMTVTPRSLPLVVGGSAVVQVQNPTGTVTVSNSATTVVSTSLSGNTITVTAKIPGSVTLSIKDSKSTATVAVTVKPPMTVTPKTLSLVVGGSAVVQVQNPTGTVTLTISDTSKVTALSGSGLYTVTGKAAGSATLTFRDSTTTKTVAVQVVSSQGNTVTGNQVGRLLASNCFQCHGTYGSGGFDKLLGKSESDLLNELNAFAQGKENPTGIMAAQACGYTPEQLAAIAKYLAKP